MEEKKFHWNKVTWYSKLATIIVVALCLALGFYVGKQYAEVSLLLQTPVQAAIYEKPVADVIFICQKQKAVHAVFLKNMVKLDLSDGRHMSLLQTISADGARYATQNESFVFWNKGDTAFVTEAGTTTYLGCNLAAGK